MNKTTHIQTLPKETQAKIKNELIRAGVEPAAMEEAMNSRLCDLADTIDIANIIKEEK